MDEAEFQHLVRIAYRERAKAISEADKRFRERMDSLRVARELSALDDAQQGNAVSPLPYGEVASRVKRLLPSMPIEFTLSDMTRAVRNEDAFGAGADNKAISVVLRRLVPDELELLEKGIGKRGSRYRKRKNENLSLAG